MPAWRAGMPLDRSAALTERPLRIHDHRLPTCRADAPLECRPVGRALLAGNGDPDREGTNRKGPPEPGGPFFMLSLEAAPQTEG